MKSHAGTPHGLVPARGSGSQFDPQVVEAFKRRYDDIDAIRRQFADPA